MFGFTVKIVTSLSSEFTTYGLWVIDLLQKLGDLNMLEKKAVLSFRNL